MKAKLIMTLGVGILCAVVLNLAFGSGLMGKNPGDDYVFAGEYYGGEEYLCYLNTGEHEIWYLNDDNPNKVTVEDDYGGPIFSQDQIQANESIDAGGDTYHKIGSFNVELSGWYWVYAQRDCEVYITSSSMNLLGFAGDVCCGAIMTIIGVALLSWGYKMWDNERGIDPEKIRKKFERTHASSPSSSSVSEIDVDRLTSSALSQPYQSPPPGQWTGTIPSQQAQYPSPPTQPSYQQPRPSIQSPPPASPLYQQQSQLPNQLPPLAPRQYPQQPLQPTELPLQGRPLFPQSQSTRSPQHRTPHPSQPDITWICPKCGRKSENKFAFCMNCGYKK